MKSLLYPRAMTPSKEKPAEKEEPAPEPAEAAETPAEKPAKPARKPLPEWVPLAMIGGFLLLAVGVGYVLWLAATTWHLVRDDNGFMSSGRVVGKQRYEDALGWGSELMVDKKPDRPARIRFLLHDAARKPITDAVVEILMYSINNPDAKHGQATLKMDEPGVYRGEVDISGSGVWEAQMFVRQGKNAYQVTQRITVP